jgi:branched-chain amino acid transport system permease protein
MNSAYMSFVGGQMLIGLINGSFYALLSLGLAIIFGMLNIINFAHGVQFMMGAFVAYLLGRHAGLGYWGALFFAPIVVGLFGIVLERVFLRHVYRLDHAYALLLTFGLAIVIEGLFRIQFGSAGIPYPIPDLLRGSINLGFIFLPYYRAWVIALSIAVCLGAWLLIDRTKLGAYLRAATENPMLVRAFGINVPLMITLTYGFGVALAALAGVLAAPIYTVSPQMGSSIIIVVFAVVVIGGMGSIIGAIIAAYALGLVEAVSKIFFPEASTTIIFVLMAIVLLARPAGLFGREPNAAPHAEIKRASLLAPRIEFMAFVVLIAAITLGPAIAYPQFLMQFMCFALFASAFNLLMGQVGLLSFGHAMFFGWAAYITGFAAKSWGLTPELAILLGGVAAGLMGLVSGWLAIRRQGIYLAMITLALAQMMFFLAVQVKFTGGEDGLQAIPRGHLFGLIDLEDPVYLYGFVVTVFLAGLAAIYRIIHSPFGEVLRAIRENEQRAISLGYDTSRYKLIAFVLSASLAGVAGGLKAIVFQIATLTDVHWHASGEVILMTLVGGLGTMIGPVLGALTVVGLQQYLAGFAEWIPVINGAVFIVCVLFFRQGLAGQIETVAGFRLPKKAAAVHLGGALNKADASVSTECR